MPNAGPRNVKMTIIMKSPGRVPIIHRSRESPAGTGPSDGAQRCGESVGSPVVPDDDRIVVNSESGRHSKPPHGSRPAPRHESIVDLSMKGARSKKSSRD